MNGLKNLCRAGNVLKIPIFLLAFTMMILARCGGDLKRFGGYYLGWADLSLVEINESDLNFIDVQNFTIMVGYGTVYIISVQLLSILAGEKWPIMNVIFSIFGACFSFALGALRIKFSFDKDNDTHHETKMAIGALAIINGGLYVADTGLAMVDLEKMEAF